MKFKINDGPSQNSQEALKTLEDTKIIKKFSAELGNHSKPQGPWTNEGFEIPQDFIVDMSNALDQYNSGEITVSFKNSAKIKNRSLFLTMREDGWTPEPKAWGEIWEDIKIKIKDVLGRK